MSNPFSLTTTPTFKAPESSWKVTPQFQGGNPGGHWQHDGSLGVTKQLNDTWSVGGSVGHSTGGGMRYGAGIRFRF